MATIIQQLRDTSQFNNDIALPDGVINIDTDTGDIRVHDGITPGGIKGKGILAKAIAYTYAYAKPYNKDVLDKLNINEAGKLTFDDNSIGNSGSAYNWIINGGFTINQREVKTPRDVAIGIYGYDRWKGHANGLEQVVEALPASQYTLTWTGGGNGYVGETTGPSPLVVDVTSGDTSIIVPKDASNASLVAGDQSNANPWPYCQRLINQELSLCMYYFQKYKGNLIYNNDSSRYLSVKFYPRQRTSATVLITNNEENNNPTATYQAKDGVLYQYQNNNIGLSTCDLSLDAEF